MARVFKARMVLYAACSCWMCRGFEYDRKEYKKETLRIIRESME